MVVSRISIATLMDIRTLACFRWCKRIVSLADIPPIHESLRRYTVSDLQISCQFWQCSGWSSLCPRRHWLATEDWSGVEMSLSLIWQNLYLPRQLLLLCPATVDRVRHIRNYSMNLNLQNSSLQQMQCFNFLNLDCTILSNLVVLCQ
jgi:hypothetical protein